MKLHGSAFVHRIEIKFTVMLSNTKFTYYPDGKTCDWVITALWCIYFLLDLEQETSSQHKLGLLIRGRWFSHRKIIKCNVPKYTCFPCSRWQQCPCHAISQADRQQTVLGNLADYVRGLLKWLQMCKKPNHAF